MACADKQIKAHKLILLAYSFSLPITDLLNKPPPPNHWPLFGLIELGNGTKQTPFSTIPKKGAGKLGRVH